MEADLMTSTNFYFLNQNFEVIHKLTQYESLMWVDKYDEPGNFEIYAPPTPEIKEAAQVNNYFRSDKSEHLMIIEKLETTVSPEDGERLIISGRSLESILDRRVLFLKCYFRDKNSEATPSSSTTVGADNLEDAIRQLLEYLFISPVHWDNETGTWVEATDRKVSNFVFQYTNEEEISSIVLKDCEFDKGENALNIVNKIVKQAGLGYKITLNSSNQFVFRLIKGANRCTDQTSNPAVIFSTKFNNLKSSKFTDDFGENFKNFVYTEGETYKSQKPTIVETGEATGLLRREVYVNSSVQHETESSNVTHSGITKEKKKLTEEEYQAALAEDAEKYYKKYASKTTLESEIEPRLTFQYGRDFAIGDILEVQDGTGNTGKVRCIEFIISHSHSGYEEYPTFESYTEDDDEPAQATASGGEFTDEGNKKGGVSQAEVTEAAIMGVRYGTKGTTTKMKIKINSNKPWMLAFNINVYQGYRALTIRVSGYNYVGGNQYWYNPESRVISDSDNSNTPVSVYFGYDALGELWVGIDGGNYTGLSITDVVNGYEQLTQEEISELFTITNESVLTTIQETQYAILIPSHIGEFVISTILNSKAAMQQIYGSKTDWLAHSGYMLWAATGSTLAPNSATKTGGNNTQSVSSVASHNHTQNSHAHSFYTQFGAAPSTSYPWNSGNYQQASIAHSAGSVGSLVIGATATNKANGATYNVSVLPNYKWVAMWERIS